MPQVRFKLALAAAELMLPLLHAWSAAMLPPVLPLLSALLLAPPLALLLPPPLALLLAPPLALLLPPPLALLLAPPLALLPVALSCMPAPCAGVAAAAGDALRAGAMASVSACSSCAPASMTVAQCSKIPACCSCCIEQRSSVLHGVVLRTS
jgi:hypothetical protein